MGINRANPNGNGGDGEITYLPLPASGRSLMFEIVKAKYAPSQREGYSDQIRFTLKVAEPDQSKLDKLNETCNQGEQYSAFVWASFGATFNGWKNGNYQPTKLAQFTAALYGAEASARVHALIKDGWIPPGTDSDDEAELDEALQWYVGLRVYAKVVHGNPDKNGKIWPRAADFTAIGDLVPNPEYEEFAQSKLRTMLGNEQATTAAAIGVAEGAEVAAKYDQDGKELKKNAVAKEEQPALVGAQLNSDYERIFGKD